MTNICVFCGSSLGNNPLFREQAYELGKLLAERKMTLVYGGSNIGLMKILADSVLEYGGKVIGVMPQLLIDHEIAHEHLSEMYIVDNLSERKNKMTELSDAFISLPGGFGTMDEIFEVLVYNQLKIQNKAIGILNSDGYFDGIIQYMNRGVQDGLLRQEHVDNIAIANQPEQLLNKLNEFQSVELDKWIDDIRKQK
jgi:uncharacterized protein (TIGR00730 family)